MDIFYLTLEQQRAFNRLKKAYKDCEKAGVFFVNRYGSLYAYNSELIDGYGDGAMHANSDNEVAVFDVGNSGQSLKIVPEWCDDEGSHYYGMTNKGFKLWSEGN
jgi:hypothetical protein